MKRRPWDKPSLKESANAFALSTLITLLPFLTPPTHTYTQNPIFWRAHYQKPTFAQTKHSWRVIVPVGKLSTLSSSVNKFNLMCVFFSIFAACKCGQNASGRVHTEETGAEDHDEISDWVFGAGALISEDTECEVLSGGKTWHVFCKVSGGSGRGN